MDEEPKKAEGRREKLTTNLEVVLVMVEPWGMVCRIMFLLRLSCY